MAVDLSCSIGGISINPCLMNTPGPRSSTPMELAALSHSRAGAVVTAPLARQPPPRPPAPYYFEFDGSSLRSPGAWTVGQEDAVGVLAAARQGGKPVIACVAATTVEDYLETATYVAQGGADLVLLDLSCRAAPDSRILGYNFRLAEKVMAEVRERVACPVGARLPIYLDVLNVEAMASAAIRAGIDFLVSVSPAAAALGVDTRGQTVLRTRDGVGELAGTAIKPMALANVRVLCQVCAGRLPVIGAGGVGSGQDALEFLLVGASAVQVGTALVRHGAALFADIESSLGQLLIGLGFTTAKAAIGRAREPAEPE